MLVAFLLLVCLPARPVRADDSAQALTSPESDEQFLKSHWSKLRNLPLTLSQHQMSANQRTFDITYYDIRLSIEAVLPHTNVSGAVTAAGKAVSGVVETVDLDMANYLTVDSVKGGELTLEFSHQNDLLSIPLPNGGLSEFQVTVFYHGNPQAYGYGAFTWGELNHKPKIYTLSEPFYARYWWPCKDHPSDKADSVDMRVTMDDRVTVVSNGKLRSTVSNGDGTKTTHWHESHPIATYLVSLAIADYYTYSDTLHYQGYTMPIDFFMYAEPGSSVRDTQAKVKDMISFYSDIFGVYPFIDEKYGHAQFGWSGGMEHQTCTSLGGNAFIEWVISHELSHQWWGDMITCGSWHDIWLNEGFARYSEALWIEHVRGNAQYHDYFDHLSFPDGEVFVRDTANLGTLFSWTVYNKGAHVLHTLRYIVGDSEFFRILKTYGASQFKYGSAVTADFQRIAEEVSDRDLNDFFQQWVYSAAKPLYEYGWQATPTDSGYLTYLFLDQTQTDYSPFKTDIDVLFMLPDTSITFRVSDTLVSQSYVYVLDSVPDSCTIDPDNWIINEAVKVPFSLHVMDKDLPSATLGIPYYHKFTVAGGTPPYDWSGFVVTLPDGLNLSEDGTLSGTPLEPGEFQIGFRVSDGGEPRAEVTRSIPLAVKVLHGDVDGKTPITLSDLLFLVKYLYKGGPSPPESYLADTNCDGVTNIVDIIVEVNYLFQRGPMPCATLP